MRYLLWSVFLGLMLTIVALLSRPLLPLDETRYLSVAWEAHETSDYLVSHLNGVPYSHKPPLLFWLINLVWAVTGVSEYAARLVSPVAGLFCLPLIWLLARRCWPDSESTANCAPQILVSLMIWMVFSPLTMFDTLLTCCMLSAMLGVLRAAEGLAGSGWLLTGFAMGVGILAKGPVILVHVVPAIIAAPWWSVRVRTHPLRWLFQGGCSVLLAITIGLSWALTSAAAGGEVYAADLLFGQTAGRMVQSFAHRQPIWWYLPWLPLCLLPWITYGLVWKGMLRTRLDSPLKFLMSSCAGSLLILSLVSGKQIHYITPTMPVFALILARLIASEQRPTDRKDLTFIVSGTLLIGVAPLLFNHVQFFDRLGLAEIVPDVYCVSLIACGVSLLVRTFYKVEHQVAAIAFSSVVVVSLTVGAGAETFWRDYDLKPLAEFAAGSDRPLAWLGDYEGQLNFVGRIHHLPVVLTDDELRRWLEQNPKGGVIMRVNLPDPDMKQALLSLNSEEGNRHADAERMNDQQLAFRNELRSNLSSYSPHAAEPRLLFVNWLRRGLKRKPIIVFTFPTATGIALPSADKP